MDQKQLLQDVLAIASCLQNMEWSPEACKEATPLVQELFSISEGQEDA